jgi:hypothetical protein
MRALIAMIVIAALPLAAWADSTPSARSFQYTVTREASRLQPADGDKSYVSIRCWQSGSTPVYVGGKDVSPLNGYPICSNTAARQPDMRETISTCESDVIELDVSNLYAVVSRPQGTPESPAQQHLVCIVAQ